MLFFICYSDCYEQFVNEEETHITNKYYDNECIICLEIKKNNETNPLKLTNHNIYIKTCNCDCLVHYYCLKMWFNFHKKCPICRINVTENKIEYVFINILLKPINYAIIFYKFIKTILIMYFNYFFIFQLYVYLTKYFIM